MKTRCNTLLLLLLFLGSLSAQAQNTRGFSKRTATYEEVEKYHIRWEINGGISASFSRIEDNSFDESFWGSYFACHAGLKQNIRLQHTDFSVIFNERIGYIECYGALFTIAGGIGYQKELWQNKSLFAEIAIGATVATESDNTVDLHTQAGVGVLFNNQLSLSFQVNFAPEIDNSTSDCLWNGGQYNHYIYPCIQLGYYFF